MCEVDIALAWEHLWAVAFPRSQTQTLKKISKFSPFIALIKRYILFEYRAYVHTLTFPMLLGSKNAIREDCTGDTCVSCFLLVLFFATARGAAGCAATCLKSKIIIG